MRDPEIRKRAESVRKDLENAGRHTTPDVVAAYSLRAIAKILYIVVAAEIVDYEAPKK